MRENRRIIGPRCAALAVGLVAACSEGGKSGGGDPAESLAVDGVLVVEDGAQARYLVDPATGRVGTRLEGRFSVVPGRPEIVHFKDQTTVVVSEVRRDAQGLPVAMPLHTFAHGGTIGFNDFDLVPFAFNAQGDRLYGGFWWDPATGESVPGGHVVASDGRHHVGGHAGGLALYRDLEPVRQVNNVPSVGFGGALIHVFTGDSQWLLDSKALTHVPSNTTTLSTQGSAPLEGVVGMDPLTAVGPPLLGSDRRGRYVFADPKGQQGTILVISACGFSNCYSTVEHRPPFSPIVRTDVAGFLADAPDAKEVTPVRDLDQIPMPREAEGYTWTLLAFTPDDRRALYQRLFHKIVSDPVTQSLHYEPVGIDFLELELGAGRVQQLFSALPSDSEGAAHAMLFPCAPPSPFEPPELRQRRSAHVRFLSADDWACGAGDQLGFVVMYVGGEPRFRPRPGTLLTWDDQTLIGHGDALEDGLCQSDVEGTIEACVPLPDLQYSRAATAQIVLDGEPRVTTGPVVSAVSHTAAVPGTVVYVVGYGFGDGGTVRLGDSEVPASAVESWTDRRVAFAMPPEPAGGGAPVPLTVVRGDETSRQRGHWIGWARPWQPPHQVPPGPITLRQGVNRLTFPGAGDFTTASVQSTDQIFASAPVQVVPEGRGPDHLDLDVEATPARVPYLWVTLEHPDFQVIRPAAIVPGLADETRWQPVGTQSIADNVRFFTTAGVLHLWQAFPTSSAAPAPAAPLLDHAPGADWRFTGFSMFPNFPRMSLGYYDEGEAWQLEGNVLIRTAGFEPIDGGVLYPRHEPGVSTVFEHGIASFGVRGDLIAVQLLVSEGPATFETRLSADGGNSFTPVAGAPADVALRFLAGVADGRAGLYGEMTPPGGGAPTLFRVRDNGTFEAGLGPPVPPGVAYCPFGLLPAGRWLLCHDQQAGRLHALDTDVAADGRWVELGGDRAGHLTAVFMDWHRDRLLAGTDDGFVLVGETSGAGPPMLAPLDRTSLGPVETPMRVHAVGALADGALVALVYRPEWSNGRLVVRARIP